MNTFGQLYRLTTFGESHGRAIGGIIDGIPPRSIINLNQLQATLDRRRPGASPLTTSRREADRLQLLSGLMAINPETSEISPLSDTATHAITLGTPIGFMVENTDARSKDYTAMRHTYRPSHADFTTDARYGIRDWRGGGRASGRETLARVVGGAFAAQILSPLGITIAATICRIGNITDPSPEAIESAILNARNNADSIGGAIRCTISGVTPGLGEPTFGKLDQMLGAAMLSIGAVKGVEFGTGFGFASAHGSEVTDCFTATHDGRIATLTNHSGGIQGGISNGMDITMRIAVKPTPTISRPLPTVTDQGQPATIHSTGRHDPCILPRIIPVVEAMASMVMLDAVMMRKASQF